MAKAEHWYAVECASHKEDEASEHVERFGLKAYVPMCKRDVLVSRHTKKREMREFPIVSGLVFVFGQDRLDIHAARRLTLPVEPDIGLHAGHRPANSDPAAWARMAASTRNWHPSPIVGVFGTMVFSEVTKTHSLVPSEIPVADIEAMVEMNKGQDKLRELRFSGKLPAHEVGTTVRLNDGPFSGFDGVVVDGLKDRLAVLVHILGRETRVEVDVAQVDAA